MTLKLYEPCAHLPAPRPHAADDRVPFERPAPPALPPPAWALQLAPDVVLFVPRRPCPWARLWQRLLLGWRWVRRTS